LTVHNYVEDEVLSLVESVFAVEEGKERTEFCTCSHCRADVACFVLNRTQTAYMTSSRGLNRRELDYPGRLQREADLAALMHEGMERVRLARRPHEGADSASAPAGAFFNFPQIMGRLFHSTTFAPVTEVTVSLLLGSDPAAMVDGRWCNPYRIEPQTAGAFSFWPRPIPSMAAGVRKAFDLGVTVDAKGFQPLRHFFPLSLESEDGWLRFQDGNRIHTLDDLFLVSEG
jgi:competence protein ComFB